MFAVKAIQQDIESPRLAFICIRYEYIALKDQIAMCLGLAKASKWSDREAAQRTADLCAATPSAFSFPFKFEVVEV